ncbi:MAG: transposase [Treponema sp.]|nr:transposase [Treponema sp.]
MVEKGRSGETYRPRYAIDLHAMTSDTFKITKEEIGETLSNFNFRRGDVVVADRAYGTLNGVNHCLNRSADYILRLREDCFAVYDKNGNTFDSTGDFAALESGERSEAAGFAALPDKTRIPVRICVKRKDKEGCGKSRERLGRRASGKDDNLREKTVSFNECIVVATSLPHSVGAGEVLETYRWRRQAEIYFKRLKSIMDFGDLPKKNPAASEAWLNGKIMVALLIEAFIAKRAFSSGDRIECQPRHMA